MSDTEFPSSVFGYQDDVQVSDDPFEAQSHIPEIETAETDAMGFPVPTEDSLSYPPEEVEELESESEEAEGESQEAETTDLEEEVSEEEGSEEEPEEVDEGPEEEIEYKYKGKSKAKKLSEVRRILGLEENYQKKHEEAAGEQKRYQELMSQLKEERDSFVEEKEKHRDTVKQSQAALSRILENPLEAYITVLKAQGYPPHEAKRRAWEHAQNGVRDQITWEAMPETERMQVMQRDQNEIHQEQLKAHQEQVARLERERQQAELRAKYAPVAHEVKLRMSEYGIPKTALPAIEQIYFEAERSGIPMTGSQSVDEYRSRTSATTWSGLSKLSPEALEHEFETMPEESRKALEKMLQKNRLSKGKATYRQRTAPKRSKKSPLPKPDRILSPSERYRKYQDELAPPDVNWF